MLQVDSQDNQTHKVIHSRRGFHAFVPDCPSPAFLCLEITVAFFSYIPISLFDRLMTLAGLKGLWKGQRFNSMGWKFRSANRKPLKRIGWISSLARVSLHFAAGMYRERLIYTQKPPTQIQITMPDLCRVLGGVRPTTARKALDMIQDIQIDGYGYALSWTEKRRGPGGHGDGVVSLRARGSFWFGRGGKEPWAHIPQYLLIQFGPVFSTVEIFALAWCLRQRRSRDKNGVIECSGRFKDACGFRLERIGKVLRVTPEAAEMALSVVCSDLGGGLVRNNGLAIPTFDAESLMSRFDPLPETSYLVKPLWIKETRAHVGMTLREAAEMIGVAHETLRRWEKGVVVPTGDQLKKVRSWRELVLKEKNSHSDTL